MSVALDWRTVAAERDPGRGIEAEMFVRPRRMVSEPIGPAGRLRTCDHCGCQGGYYLQPLAGLPGKYECRRQRACEKRILRRRG